MHHCCSVYSISCTGPGWLNELGHWITGTCKGRFQDFKLGGALKKIAPSEGRREIFWVFRVKNHDFTPKNHIFSNFRRTRAGCPPPPGSAPACFIQKIYAPSSSLLQGKHLLFSPSPLRLIIFRLFVILSLT